MRHVSNATKDMYKQKKKTPVGRVDIYDTPYTVPSNGFRIEFSEGLNGSSRGDIVYAGNDSRVMFDWGEGVPSPISSSIYQVYWMGYFYARFTGTYSFTLLCPTAAAGKWYMSTNQSVHCSGLSTLLFEKEQGAGIAESGTFVATAGTWYPIRIEYWSYGAPSHIVALFREPEGVQDADGKWSDYDSDGSHHNGTVVEEHKVLSAGNVNYDLSWENAADASFLSPVKLPVFKIEGKKRLGDITEYNFEIGLGTEKAKGSYSYDPSSCMLIYNSPNLLGNNEDPTFYTEKGLTKKLGGSFTTSDDVSYFPELKCLKTNYVGDDWARFMVTPTSSEAHTFSAWVYMSDDYTTQSWLHLPRLQYESNGASEWIANVKLEKKPGVWQRASVTVEPDGTGENARLVFYNVGAVAGSIYFTAPMWEEGTIASPFSTPQQAIKKFRLVDVYMGYQSGCNFYSAGTCTHVVSGWFSDSLCGGIGNPECPYNRATSDAYMQRFRGRITDFDFARSSLEETVSVICQDFQSFLKNSVDENYPDTASYMAARYYQSSTDDGAGPNGLTKPKAYDGWPLDKVVRDLCLHAGIDSSLLYEREEATTTSGTLFYSDYLIEGKNTRLFKNYNYGVTNSVYPKDWTIDDPAPPNIDEAYNFKSDFGGTILDRLVQLSETFGYFYGTRNDGAMEFKSVNTPTIFSHLDTGDIFGWTPGGFTSTNEIKAIQGGYLKAEGAGATATCRAFGSKFILAFVRDENAGYTVGRWTMYDSFMTHVEPGGYAASQPTISQCLEVYEHSDGTTRYKDTYFVFETDDSFDIEALKINVGHVHFRPLDAGESVTWTFDIEVGELDIDEFQVGGMAEVVESASYEKLANGLDAFEVTREGDRVYETNSVTLKADTFYAIKFSTNTYTHTNATSNFYGTIKLNGTRAGHYHTSLTNTTPGNWYIQAIWPDIDFISLPLTEQSVGVKVTRVNDSEVVYHESGNLYYSGEWYFYDSISPDTGKNPSVWPIYAQDLVDQDNYLGWNAADTYDIEVENISGDTIKIEGLLAYSEDSQAAKWGFYGGYGELNDLKIDIKSEDLRNDTFVIGARKGPIRNLDGKIINPNNPEIEFSYARATDLNSIYGINSINAAGFNQPFILQLPNVKTDDHAKWLAIEILKKYRQEVKEVSASVDGVGHIELGDAIGVGDSDKQTLSIYSPLWVNSISESIDASPSYVTSLELSSVEPWESYITKEEPDIADFLDSDGNPQAFVNVSITTTRVGEGSFTGISGYDCYESEQQNYIKITYYQVINGNVRVYVFPSGAENKKANRVSILIPPSEGGAGLESEPVYQDWGKHEVLWDGIAWSQNGRPTMKDIGLYVEDGSWGIGFELIDSAQNVYNVFSDNLPTNDDLNETGEIFIVTELSEYPTAGKLTISPTGCGAGHRDVLSYDENGFISRIGEIDYGHYWSTPNRVSCADFTSDNVSFSFSASGYHTGTAAFTDRWVTGKVRLFVVEQLLPDIFEMTYNGSNLKLQDEQQWRHFTGLTPNLIFNYPIGMNESAYWHPNSTHWRAYYNNWGVGGPAEVITDVDRYSIDIEGFFNIDTPFNRNINPRAWVGINTNTALTYNKIELKRCFHALEYGIDDSGLWWWTQGSHGWMHYKAVVIDFSLVKDRAGRPIAEYFHYGSGGLVAGIWGGGIGTEKTGYRYCRFDRMYGQLGTNKNTCGAAIWEGGNIWENVENVSDWNRPQYYWGENDYFDTCTQCNSTCKYSRTRVKDAWFPGFEDDNNNDVSRCKNFKILEDKSPETVSMINLPFNKYALQHVIFWHDSDYDYYPFNWTAGSDDVVKTSAWHSSSEYYCGYREYYWKRVSAAVCLGEYYASRVLANGDLVGSYSDGVYHAEAGQIIEPR